MESSNAGARPPDPHPMIVAKQFTWEAAHRLPWHGGPCRHLHGHSYRMVVEIAGTPDERGMVLDFQDLKHVLKPLVDAWDHATLVHDTDAELLGLLAQTDWKRTVVPCDTTSENLARLAADYLCQEGAALLQAARAHTVRVRLQETDTCYAVYERPVDAEPITAPEALARLAAPAPA